MMKSQRNKMMKRRRSWTRNVTRKKRMMMKRKRSVMTSLRRNRPTQSLSHA